MRHHRYKNNFNFIKEPEKFDKYSDREFLQYCLGAILYTPGTKDIKNKILTNKFEGLTTIVLDFEDGISKNELVEAENNVIDFLEFIYNKLNSGKINRENLPLFFIRVRNFNQFQKFSSRLSKKHIEILTGIEFPKFNTDNGLNYLNHLKKINEKYNEILYALPVMEDEKVAYKENRIEELSGLKNIFDSYKNLIINLGVGVADFSSIFNLRRNITQTVYDLMIIKGILADISNYFNRNRENYVFAGAVWEYFLNENLVDYANIKNKNFPELLFRREKFINKAIDGLLREIILDKANGYVGKVIIHPSQIKFVNAMQAVNEEKYEDAKQILETAGGVIKSKSKNKMNEIKPHKNWAKKIIYRAKAYGVIKSEKDYLKLISNY